MNTDRLKSALTAMYRRGLEKKAVQELFRQLRNILPEQAKNLNPNQLAIKADLSFSQTLQLVTYGVLDGLFEMEWHVYCPRCNNLNQSAALVKELNAHEHCAVCGHDYEPLGDQNITVTVSLHPRFFEKMPQSDVTPQHLQDDRVKPLTLLDLIGFPEFRQYFVEQVPRLDQNIKIGQVSVVFTDLIQSTALYSRIGDPEAFALVNDHFQLLFNSITRHFGGVVKTIGDAVMAVFTAPEHALKAAVEIKNSVTAFLEERVPDYSTGIRIGIHNGPAVLVNLNNNFDLFGATVNLTARIVNHSPYHSVAVSEAYYQLSEVQHQLNEQNFPVEQLQLDLKGITDRQKIYLIRTLKN